MTKPILTMSLMFLVFGVSLKSFSAETITVSTKGMVCNFCAQGIEKKFKSVSSVEKVNVSLEKKEVILSLKDQQSLSDQEINEIIQNAGYNVEKIERKK